MVSILFAFSKFLINRFKFLIYILIALLTWSALVWINFIGMLMFAIVGDSKSIEGIYQPPLTPIYIIFILLLFIFACGLYAWYYLPKNQGKVWAFNQVKEGNRKKTWWNNFAVAFAGATIIPSLPPNRLYSDCFWCFSGNFVDLDFASCHGRCCLCSYLYKEASEK